MIIKKVKRSNIGLFSRAPVPVEYMERLTNITPSMGLMPSYFQTYLDDTRNYLASDEYLQEALAAGNFNDGVFMDISIYLINKFNYREIQTTMQEYILASPFVENKVQTGEMLGYIGVEFDRSKQYNTLSGLLRSDGEYMYTTTYYGSEPKLTKQERDIILESWDNVRGIWYSGIDPTDLR